MDDNGKQRGKDEEFASSWPPTKDKLTTRTRV